MKRLAVQSKKKMFPRGFRARPTMAKEDTHRCVFGWFNTDTQGQLNKHKPTGRLLCRLLHCQDVLFRPVRWLLLKCLCMKKGGNRDGERVRARNREKARERGKERERERDRGRKNKLNPRVKTQQCGGKQLKGNGVSRFSRLSSPSHLGKWRTRRCTATANVNHIFSQIPSGAL